METTAEAVKQTLAEYERLAISTGATVQIDPPEFYVGPQLMRPEWSPIFTATEDALHPEHARVTVHRDGIPTTVYVAWDEALPAKDSWRDLWERKPMTLFGAFTIRAALRRAYRDVIGDQHEPDDMPDSPPASDPVDRDWLADLAECNVPGDVHELHAQAKAARAVTPRLEVALRQKLRDLADARPAVEAAKIPDPSPSRPKPAQPAVRPEDTVHTVKRPARKGRK